MTKIAYPAAYRTKGRGDRLDALFKAERLKVLNECEALAAMIEGPGGKVTEAIAKLKRASEK